MAAKQKTVWVEVGYTRPIEGKLLQQNDQEAIVLFTCGAKVHRSKDVFDTEQQALEVAIKRAEYNVWVHEQAILTYKRLLTECQS